MRWNLVHYRRKDPNVYLLESFKPGMLEARISETMD